MAHWKQEYVLFFLQEATNIQYNEYCPEAVQGEIWHSSQKGMRHGTVNRRNEIIACLRRT